MTRAVTTFGERRFTISNRWAYPRHPGFANEKRQVNLAISLHAADDDQRSAMLAD
jgi:23S rRNA (adenine2503-C2)-methyltransferase